MKQVFALLAIGATVLFSACKGGDSAQEAAPVVVAKASSATSFTPPANGLLTPEKAKAYVDASAALLLLSQQWTDRLDNAKDGQEKILILGGFEAARNQVLNKVGLAGTKEFNWISNVALKNPANNAAALKAGIQLGSK